MHLAEKTTATVLLSVALTACLPAQLDKYRKDDKQTRADTGNVGLGAPDMAPPSSMAGKAGALGPALPQPPPAAAAAANPPARATIYAIDKQTFRFAVREGDVWESVLSVLLRNYSLTIVDHQAGIVSTEWDSYFLNNAVYRNKLSIRVARVGGGADVTVHNSVERLRDASQAAGAVGAVWLPSPDPGNEVVRIVQNMALVLGQPPPVLPPNAAVARGTEKETINR